MGFRISVTCGDMSVMLLVIVDEDARTVGCFGILPLRAPAPRRAAVAEVMMRLNYRFNMGAFDMDFDDGEMRYRLGCDVEGGELTQHMALTMLGNVCATISSYAEALMRVMFEACSPEDAVRDVMEKGFTDKS